MNLPYDVAPDGAGNLYIADSQNGRVRKVDTNGIITTIAGNGSWGYAGDGGPAGSARLNYPRGIGLDSSGNLYIADTSNHRVREVPFGGHPTLTLDPVTPANAGDYSVIISSPWGSMTSAVATVTVLIRPAISKAVPNLDGSLTLSCAGTPNSTNRLWLATSLAPPIAWSALLTNIADGNGNWQCTDTTASNSPMRFYRLSMP